MNASVSAPVNITASKSVRTLPCSPNAAGLSVGVLWAVSTFFLGFVAIFGWGDELVKALASLYIGYSASFLGAIIGSVWALVDGYIAGFVVTWLYNLLTQSTDA